MWEQCVEVWGDLPPRPSPPVHCSGAGPGPRNTHTPATQVGRGGVICRKDSLAGHTRLEVSVFVRVTGKSFLVAYYV